VAGWKSENRWAGAVAVVLAIGLATAVNVITFASLYDAIAAEGPGLSENATQIMTTAFGGIIGVLGGYLGFRAGERSQNGKADKDESGEPDG
jgi:hypothetical protein